jgi:hypothetical protein
MRTALLAIALRGLVLSASAGTPRDRTPRTTKALDHCKEPSDKTLTTWRNPKASRQPRLSAWHQLA